MSRRPLSDLHRTAFLTGASAGLGRAFADMLLDEGVHVWGTARDAGRLTGLATRHPALFTPVVLDLTDTPAADAAFERAQQAAGGGFDLVINNAGYGVFGPFAAMEIAVWEAQLQTMLVSTIRLAHAALRGMQRRGRGCLVNVSSMAAEFPLPYMSGYNVAKAGLSAFTESLLVETRGSEITVVDLRLGDFRTDFNQVMQSISGPALAADPAPARAWRALEANLRNAPPPARAAEGLRRALARRRSGTVRLGSFFQTRLAPFLARFVAAPLRRRVAGWYLGT